MSESKTNENKEPIDESEIDWSGFGDAWEKRRNNPSIPRPTIKEPMEINKAFEDLIRRIYT